jgi:hypothetical protein
MGRKEWEKSSELWRWTTMRFDGRAGERCPYGERRSEKRALTIRGDDNALWH